MLNELYSYDLVEGEESLPLIICIAGYCQTGVETWGETIKALQAAGVHNAFLVIERKHGFNAGRQTIGDQTQALRDYLHYLMTETQIINRKVIWVGHSFGALLAQKMTATWRMLTAGMITLGPVSTTGWWIFFNPKFWWHGGFVSLPAVAWSVFTGRSVQYPPEMARGLFAGEACSDHDFARFLKVQQPDSAWIFVQFLFAYWISSWTVNALRGLHRERKLTIGFKQDNLLTPWSIRRLAAVTDTPMVMVDCSHCWWLSDGIQEVAKHIGEAINRINELK